MTAVADAILNREAEVSITESDARSAPPLEQVTAYLEHLCKERDVSPHTTLAYRRDLADFVAYLERSHGAESWTWQTWIASRCTEPSGTSPGAGSGTARSRGPSPRCGSGTGGCTATRSSTSTQPAQSARRRW